MQEPIFGVQEDKPTNESDLSSITFLKKEEAGKYRQKKKARSIACFLNRSVAPYQWAI
jgi:hypothetical protein